MNNSSFTNFLFRALYACLISAGLVIAQTASPSARSTFEGLTAKGLEPGSPAGSYALSGFDTINPYSGHINFSLPLMPIGGRGEAGYTMHLPIGQKWDLHADIDPTPLPGCSTPCITYNFVPDWWGNLDYSYRAASIGARHTGESPSPVCFPAVSGAGEYHYGTTLTRLTVRMADGTEIELRDALTAGQPKSSTGLVNCQNLAISGFNRGRTWVAADGSGATFISNVDIRDSSVAPAGTSKPSGVFYTREGKQYHFNSGNLTMIRDRNGNKTTFSAIAGPDSSVASFSITDPVGRTVEVMKGFTWTDAAGSGTYDQIKFSGNGGDRYLKIYRRDYYNDRVCLSESPVPSGCSTASKPTLYQLFGGVSPGLSIPVISVSKVELPDGRTYKFYYNDYAELARVVLPTGGAYEYDWVNGVAGATYPLVQGEPNSTQVAVYRRISQRREYPNGETGNSWTRRTSYAVQLHQNNANLGDPAATTNAYRCNASANSWCSQVSITESSKASSAGVGAAQTLSVIDRFYYGSPKEGMFLSPYHYSAWAEGREFKTVVTHPGGAGSQTELHTWQQRATPIWWTNENSGVPPQGPQPALDPRKVQTDRKVEDGRMARTSFSYSADAANNPVDVDEYAFGTTGGTLGDLIRRTHTDYEVDSAYASITEGSAPFVNTGSHLRGLPVRRLVCSTTTCTASNFYAKTEYSYDTSSIGALIPRTAATGHDGEPGAYGSAFTKRGNLTEVKVLKKKDPSEAWLSTKFRYDILGNVVEIKDPKSNSTTINYSDKFGLSCGASQTPETFAFQTAVTNPSGWTNSACYSYSLGRAIKFIGPNSSPNKIETIVSYESSGLDRIVGIVRASGSSGTLPRQTTFSYVDTIGALKVRTASSQLVESDTNLKTEVQFDGLGRKTRTITSEDGTFESNANRSQVDIVYDGLGRPSATSNPYRPGGSVALTTTSYDALGRVTQVIHPDESILTKSYFGSTIKIKDEACRTKEITQDALGRTVEVREDTELCAGDTTAPEGHSTIYQYNVSDHLTDVTQGSQVRTFTYDLAGRLLTAQNPESGQVTYTYDDNGNLETSTDSRNFVNTRTYDALDRISSITHPDGLGNIQTSYLCYDGKSATSAGCSGSSAVFGPLTSSWTSISNSNYTALNSYIPDALGRIVSSSQTIDGGVPSVFAYAHNADDSVRSITYPSGRNVAYDYDLAGRTAKVGLGAVGATDYVDSASYTPFGALATMALDNGVSEEWGYNNRQQVQSIGVVKSGLSLLGISYGYSAAKNNGNVTSQTINAGNQKTYSQSYTYDDLNRLKGVSETTAGASAGAWSATYCYDRFGNRWVCDSTFPQGFSVPTGQGQYNPANNRLIKTYNNVDLPANAYDSAGNLQNHPQLGAMTYDGQGRLVQHVTGSATVRYYYDAEGRRVKKDVSNAVTRYIYDAVGHLAAEQGGGSVDVCARCFVTSDALGSTRLVTDNVGAVMQRRDYMPFGEEVASSAVFGARQSVFDGGVARYNTVGGTKIQFTGKERDAETGLDFFGSRYVSAQQGRFTSPDPFNPIINYQNASAGEDEEEADQALNEYIQQPQNWNRYAYGLNNPNSFVDKNGEHPVVAVIWLVAEVAATAYDGYATVTTLTDPNATMSDKVLQVGGFVAGLAGPGGGYGTVIKKVSNSTEVGAALGKAKSLIGELHHIATDKSLKPGSFTDQFKQLFDKAGLNLNDPANLVRMITHKGRHAKQYHQYVLERLRNATNGLTGKKFREALIRTLNELREELLEHEEMLKRWYWE